MPEPTTLIREYKNRAAFERDANRLAADGYTVVTTTERTRRRGCLTILLTGGFALIRRPAPLIAVTYRRD
jgi:hypothetical protein